MEEREPRPSCSEEQDRPAAGAVPGSEVDDAAPDLRAELDRERQLAEERGSRLLRLKADFDNYRKRMAREQARWHQDARCELVTDLLPVIDNLERALTQEGDSGSIRQGLELINRQLMETLGRYGVEKIEAAGNRFDPELHEAVMQEETDQHDDGIVTQELLAGYRMGDRLLRPSAVKVAVNPSHRQDEEGDER